MEGGVEAEPEKSLHLMESNSVKIEISYIYKFCNVDIAYFIPSLIGLESQHGPN